LAGAIYVYPTLPEISKVAAGSYFAEKFFRQRTKNILLHLFDRKVREWTLPEGLDEPGKGVSWCSYPTIKQRLYARLARLLVQTQVSKT
jgi:hypothetical protein